MSDEENQIYSTAAEVASPPNIGSGGESIYSLGTSSRRTREESKDEEAIDNTSMVIGKDEPQPLIDHNQYRNENQQEWDSERNVGRRIDMLYSHLSLLQKNIESKLDVLSEEPLPEGLQHEFQLPESIPGNMQSSLNSFGGNLGFSSKSHMTELFPRDKLLTEIVDSLMNIKETPSQLRISIEDFKGIIFKERVSFNLLLAVVGGLPYCGKSQAIHNLLRKVLISPAVIKTNPTEVSMQNYVPQGLSSYGVVIVGGKPFNNLIWMPETITSTLLFSCGSAILHNSLLQGQQVELVDTNEINKGKKFECFKDDDLNTYLHQTYEDVDTLLHQGDLNPEIKRILPSGITTVKVIDTSMNQGVYDFLALTARYCHRQFGFAYLDLERDLPSLQLSPEINPQQPSRKNPLKSGTRIYYLIRFAAVTYFSASCPSTLFIALHDGKLLQSDVDARLEDLKKAIRDEIVRQGLPQEMVYGVIAVNRSDESSANFKRELEKMVMKRHSAMIDLKLGWVFLRNLLRNSSKFSGKLCISLKELQPLAKEMRIDSDFDDFLKVYTECGSFLYIPEILPKHVILRPQVFINHLQSLYHFDGSENGLITKSEVQNKLGEEVARVVIQGVCNSGLGVEVQKSRIVFQEPTTKKSDGIPILRKTRASELFLFIPYARMGEASDKKEHSSLFIVYQSKIIPSNMAGKFLKELLPISKLISTPEKNAISVKLDAGVTLTLLFHPKYVELKLHPFISRLSFICCNILKSISKALLDIIVFFPDLTYKFALLCLETSEFEFLSVGAENQLCETCKTFPKKRDFRKEWHDAVKHIETSTKSKDLETLSLESLTHIAKDLTKIQYNKRQFADALGIDKEEWNRITTNYVGYKQNLSMLLAWVTRVGTENATRQGLFDIFFQAEPRVLSVLRNL